MKHLIILLLIAFTMASCNSDHEKSNQTEPPNTLNPEIIKLEFAVSFIGQSLVYVDLSRNSILVSKVNTVCYPPDINPDYYLTPEEEFISLENSEIDVIQGSVIDEFGLIKFESNINNGYDDGFFINVLIAYSNDSVAHFDLQNGMNINQQALLSKIIDHIVSNSKSNLNVKYFTKVNETINRQNLAK